MATTLEGTRVLVTAGARGIGRAIAGRFRDAGAKVHICDVDEAALNEALDSGEGLSGTQADVASPDQVENLLTEAVTTLGGLNVLVNNAGIGGPRAPTEDLAYADWDRTIAVNLNGMFYVTKNAIPHLKAAGGGSIVNLSTASVRTGMPNRTAYIAGKAGVMGLTKNLARELGPDGIRVNAILPGLIDNERGRTILETYATEQGKSVEETEETFLKYVSLRTWIDPAEVGDAAVFLASPAGRKITGQYLGVDGNYEWEM